MTNNKKYQKLELTWIGKDEEPRLEPFEDFDLDLSKGFDFNVMNEEIFRQNLKDKRIDTIGVQQGAFLRNTPVSQLISELINYPEIDYDSNAELLQKLCRQAIDHFEKRMSDKSELILLIRQYRKIIANKIYIQMIEHFRISEPEYVKPKVLPFVKIEDWNFTALPNNYRDYRDSITPVSSVPKYVFRGFEKACHLEYKFDSKTEKDLASILESDKNVIKWLRPAPNQFRIYYKNNSRQYYPDFVIETNDVIYIAEIKAEKGMFTADVQEKKKAAEQYCKYATAFTSENQGKKWRYMLIPHSEVTSTTTFEFLVNRYVE